jgi:NitT/TauT family transport system substrate-binding protein
MRRAFAAVVLSVAIALAPSAAPLDLVKIRWSAYAGMAPVFIGQGEGFFAKEGIQLEPVDMVSGSAVIPALVRGDIDVLPGVVLPAMFNTIARGGRLRLVGSQIQFAAGKCPYVGIVVTPAFAGSGALTSADRVRGRTISQGTNLITTYFADQALKPLGLGTDDLQGISVPDSASVEALRTGRLDFAILGQPALTRALAGGAVLWKVDHAVLPNFQYSAVAFGPSLLDARPDVGRRFMTAYLRGVRQFLLGMTPRNMDLLTKPLDLPRADLSTMCWPNMVPTGAITGDTLLEFQKWGVAKGLIDRAISLQELIDTRFIDAANKTLGPFTPVR